MATSKQPHPLADMLLTVVLPSIVLEWASKPERLGPLWALVLASAIPLGFGLWCWQQKRGLNFFSIFGLVAVILTGSLGLLNLNAFWFAAKEALFPIILGLAFPLSHYFGTPLINELLLNPQVINHRAIQASLDSDAKKQAFAGLLQRASWGMLATTFASAAANFALALHLIGGTEPGSEAYVKAIGKLNWMGFLVIGIPLVGLTLLLLFWLIRRISALTGLDREDLLNPGTTVRRRVG
ncbi:MAG: hypothetical protein KDK99_10975 [Verrucomicrobiales bacterium]|nr:hypothetical protein [Verrucomicrobiales bacterium]